MTPLTRDERIALVRAHRGLVEHLDEAYPERSPNPSDDEREVWMKAGERRLVRKLLELRDAPDPTKPRR